MEKLIDKIFKVIYDAEIHDQVDEGLTYIIGRDEATVIAPNGATLFQYKFDEEKG